ncbi:class I adenylate-forming enzyme family protein [uncultured Litoreibacter sp.]|uniref:class I adenylate-forming enzyme family protein n=1 Tax=uncultured Litoreibacter sp. TaxID=1392394 RepID=UPI002639B83E|nr:class I adenylate-forming enzyme family protein [uncultured Litoreibacter sp.]
MSSVFDQGPPVPCPDPFNMAAYVLAHADRLAAKPALLVASPEGGISTLTFEELKARVAEVAGGLAAQGLTQGDRVLFRLGNTPDFPIAYLACIWGGFVPVPASAALSVPEITEVARQSEPALTLHDGQAALPSGATNVLDQLPVAPPISPVMGDPNRLAYIVFTSGTSGTPRGVCHAHRAIWARRMMHQGWYGLTEADRVMHAGAFNWTFTLGTGLMDPWSVGATALIAGDGMTPDQLPACIKAHDISIFAAAPGVYRKMLQSDLPPMPRLRHGLSAGEHLAETIRQDWTARTGTELHQAMGMSECSTFISSSPAHPAPPDTSGRPQPGRRVAVIKDGAPVPFNTPGELAVARTDPGLMIGYLGDAPVQGAWFATGDMAQMTEDGTITYLGRGDDMMNAGGYRVSPLEVEACFNALSGVTACAAVQVEVKAHAFVIALYVAGTADEQAMRAHAEQNLAPYKRPRLYIRRDALPYGANGKLNRRALRATYEAP